MTPKKRNTDPRVATHLFGALLLTTPLSACCPQEEGVPTDPEEPDPVPARKPETDTEGPNGFLGRQPAHACLDLSGAAPTEIASVQLRYKGYCPDSQARCFEAQTLSSGTWVDLDARHNTFVPLVYFNSILTGGPVAVSVTGPSNQAWWIRYAVNTLSPTTWSAWTLQDNDPWSPPSADAALLDVGTRHMATLRVQVHTENPNDTGNPPTMPPADPLVILVPKRPNKACSTTNPFYVVPM